jgi:catechol 2,3-dioxygenase-like lactoylglutathione lyase family enzyme
MSASKAKAKTKAKKVVRKAVKRPTTAKRKVTVARKAAAPVPPPPWTADIQDLNLAWYNVTDWPRARRFYEATLGLPVAFALDDMGWVEYGRGLPHLAISRWNESGPVPVNGGVAVLTCPDVRAGIARLREKGVRCDEVQEIPNMVILGTFYDPDGNKLQLAQSLAGPA